MSRRPKALPPNARAASAAAALMRPRVYEARLRGMSYSRIGRALGISTTTAFEHYTEYVRQHQHEPEEIERIRALEIERLEFQREKLTPGLESPDPMVKARTSDALIRIADRRSRLQGLDAPTRVDVGVSGQVFTAEELAAAARTFLERRAQPALPPAIDLEARPGGGEDAGERVPGLDPAGVGE